MMSFAAQGLMELQVIARTGTAYDKKDPVRLAQRSGYRDGEWETRAHTAQPSCRQPNCAERFLFCFPASRRLAGQALTAVIQDFHIKPISTPSLVDLIQCVGMCVASTAVELTTSRIVPAEEYMLELRIL